jgi:hypothetical protein
MIIRHMVNMKSRKKYLLYEVCFFRKFDIVVPGEVCHYFEAHTSPDTL